MSDCTVCNDMIARLTSVGGKDHMNLGSFEEAETSSCPDHTPLIKAFKEHCDGSHNRRTKSNDVGFHGHLNGHQLTLYESVSQLGFVWDFMLVHRPSISNHHGVGRILDPDWVDLDFINKAKRKCSSEHGAKCQNPIRVPPATPAWLVDVENGCIVPGEGRGPYVALSYVRGQSSGLQLHGENMDQLRRHGCLNSHETSSQLPLMVQHAIKLVAAIHERYLWVDCLCIVHGGQLSTAEQLNIMSAIYASAVVTIVAADGSSADGLLGLKDISPSRRLEQRIFSIKDEKVVRREVGIFSLTHGAEYYNRAWTYQEFTMSPRKIFFNSREVHWQCQCSLWHEETVFPTELDKYIDPRPGIMLAGFPDLGSLSHSLTNYNERKLSYDEDALSGIAGYLAILSRCFTGGFLYGCPEMFFDRALSWQPFWNHTNLRRRTTSNRSPAERVGSTALPSWSWIGWSGMISLRYGEAARLNDRCQTLEETIPTTEWYTSSALSGNSRRRIRSTWFENRNANKEWVHDLAKPLPKGWTRHEAESISGFRDEPRLFPDSCSKYLFQHDAMPDPDCQQWFYPFPLPKITESTPCFTPEQTQYLFCKTKGTNLWAERVDYEKWPEGGHQLKLRDEKSGSIIGRMRLHNDEQFNTWPAVKTPDEVADGKTVEVVAIHETIWYEKTFNKELQRCDHPLKREERVAVLWIEWENEIAYRLSCGWVNKQAWEGLDLKEVDLVLG